MTSAANDAEDLPHSGPAAPPGRSVTARLCVAVVVGAAIGAAVSLPSTWRYGLPCGWMAAAFLASGGIRGDPSEVDSPG